MIVQAPKYSQFSEFEIRCKTFTNWVQGDIKAHGATEFAEAGFFYINSSDKLVCYYCGVGIMDWLDTDNPWEEHARWSPNCQHILSGGEMGRVNVQTVEERKKPCNQESPIILDADNTRGPSMQGVPDLCLKCGKHKPNIVFLPCFHLNICNICYPSVPTCPTCQTDCYGVQRVYTS